MKKIPAMLLIAGIFIWGCASKGTVKETAQPQQKVAEQKQSNDKEAKKESENVSSKKSADLDSIRLIKEMQARMKDIHFDFDRYVIKTDDKPILKIVAEALRKNSTLKVTIEGNCDDRGTNEYNLALGDRRATSAKEYLLSLGIESGRMDTVSYGEEKPLCTENTESCWAKNRRDHFDLGANSH